MARRRRRSRAARKWRIAALLIAALPALYLLAALAGSLIPVNRGWSEPEQGVTVYLADNGVHADLLMPVRAAGLDWAPLLPKSDFRRTPPGAQWLAFGAGEERVYLETPTWWDLTPRTIWAALTGGNRVIHVEYVAGPAYALREIRLRPEEYRRLWAAVRAEMELDSDGKPIMLDHPGYGPADRFYEGRGRASAFRTCNSWVADRLRLAGVETSLWSPFAQGLLWRYRQSERPVPERLPGSAPAVTKAPEFTE